MLIAQVSAVAFSEDVERELRLASIRGDRTRIAEALYRGASLSSTSLDGFTPLLWAVYWDHTDAALDLLAAGADISHRTNSGWTALGYSTLWGNLRLTQALLNKGADAHDQLGDPDRSIAFNAIVGGNPQVLALILTKDKRIPTKGLQAAALYGHEEIVDMLLTRGADPNIGGDRGYSPLITACEHWQWRIAQKLIRAGADVNRVGYCCPECTLGHTALSQAASLNSVEMVRFLLAAKADVHARGELAIREAELAGNVEVYQLLKAAGAIYPGPKESHPALELIRSGKYPQPSAQAKSVPPSSFDIAKGPIAAPARSGSSGEVRIAILADDRLAGDALTAAMSQQPGFALLERREIERILTEHKVTESSLVQGTGSASLGTLLAADAVVTVHRSNADGSPLYQTRMISVGTGVVLDSVFHPAPLRNVQSWAENLTQRISVLKEKFAQNSNSAIALAFLNVKATLGTAQGRQLEEEFNLLLTHRLVREPSLFVLDRTEMDRLMQEKNLATGKDSPFQGGAYLVDGKIDLQLSVSNIVSIHLRFQPAAASNSVPIQLSVEGDPNHLPELVESVATRINEQLVKRENNSTAAWNPQDEARRFLQEAKWAKACKLPEVASIAAESSWALGLHTPEVANFRVWSRVASITEQKDRAQKNIRDSISSENTLLYQRDPLNNPFRGANSPTPAEVIDEGIRLLEVTDDAFHIDPNPDPTDFLRVLSTELNVIQLIATASDKIENAQSLILLRQLLKQITEQGVTRWPDNIEILVCNIRMAQFFCETNAEFIAYLEKTFQHHFPTDDVLNRAELRAMLINFADPAFGTTPWYMPRWRDAWKAESIRLCKSPFPEDQFVASFAQYQLDPNTRVRREVAHHFIEQFKALLPTIATDTRAAGPYQSILRRLPFRFEISPFFYWGNTDQAGLVAVTHTVPWNDLMRDSFVYLCEKSSHIDYAAFDFGSDTQNLVHAKDPTVSGVREAVENLLKMNEALDAHSARITSVPGCDPAYLSMLNAHKFSVPVELLGESKPSTPGSSPTVSSSPCPKPGALLIERSYNPSESAGLEQGHDTLSVSGQGALWAEDRLWYYGEVGHSEKSIRRGYVFATDLKTFKTEVIPLPPFTSALNGFSRLAITPSRLFVCRAGEMLAVYYRDTKQWKLYSDIKPKGDYAPLASGDRVYLVFETADNNVGIVTVCDEKTDILASTRRNPPETPVDLPGGYIELLGFNKQGEICVRAGSKWEGQRYYSVVLAAYSAEKKTWREMKKPELRDLPLPQVGRIHHSQSGPGGVTGLLAYQGYGYDGTIPIQFKSNTNKPNKIRSSTVIGTPDGLVFLERDNDAHLWFVPAEEVKQAFSSGTSVSQPEKTIPR